MIARHKGERVADVAVEHDDPCWFFFTSGTTGRSKAAVLTHGQMGFVITNHLCDLVPGTTEADCSLVVAPLSHGAGVHQLMLAARGAASILLPTERFDIDEAWRLIAHHRVTSLFTVPTILKMLVEHPAVEQHDHSSLRYVIYAGAPMYREDQKRALATLGSVLVQYFGLGEVTGNITVLPPSLHVAEDGPQARVGSCGYARTAMQVQIQDEAGEEVASGVQGEICVIGRRSSPAITTTRKPMRSRSGTAGSAPAISAIWTRRASSTSPAAPRTCTSPAARTSIRARSRRRS